MLINRLACIFLRRTQSFSTLYSLCKRVHFTVNKSKPPDHLYVQIFCRQFITSSVNFKSKDRPKVKTKHIQTQVDTREIDAVLDVNELIAEFDKEIMQMKSDFAQNLSLRTSVGSLECLNVKYKGKKYRIDELAKVSRKPKEVILDLTANTEVIPEIYSLLTSTEMRLNPIKSGYYIQVPIPKVTKEYRETLAKNAKSLFNKYSNKIKQVKNSNIKAVQEIEKLPIDQCRRIEANIDALSKQYVEKAQSILNDKIKELSLTAA